MHPLVVLVLSNASTCGIGEVSSGEREETLPQHQNQWNLSKWLRGNDEMGQRHGRSLILVGKGTGGYKHTFVQRSESRDRVVWYSWRRFRYCSSRVSSFWRREAFSEKGGFGEEGIAGIANQ